MHSSSGKAVDLHHLLIYLPSHARPCLLLQVAGDFNTTPGSAAHSMLVKGSVQPTNPVSCTVALTHSDGGLFGAFKSH